MKEGERKADRVRVKENETKNNEWQKKRAIQNHIHTHKEREIMKNEREKKDNHKKNRKEQDVSLYHERER